MTIKDFRSKQKIRWCSGCGNYIVLATVQQLLSEMKIAKENVVCISGIGCSSRFVYYLDTYGFHTIHGRATAVAAGLKIARPELSVWVVIGDGDGLSIGLNHLLHLMRRNIDVNILMLNNKVYGLTKGQHSPTSDLGVIRSSSPFGNIDKPFDPITLALAAECSFVARTIDADPVHLSGTIRQAIMHKGTSFIEILQNCPIYNNEFLKYKELQFRQNNCVYLNNETPVRFGKLLEKGIKYSGQALTVVDNVIDSHASDLLIHDQSKNNVFSPFLANMHHYGLPLALGVFCKLTRQTYDEVIESRKNNLKSKYNRSLEQVLQS